MRFLAVFHGSMSVIFHFLSQFIHKPTSRVGNPMFSLLKPRKSSLFSTELEVIRQVHLTFKRPQASRTRKPLTGGDMRFKDFRRNPLATTTTRSSGTNVWWLTL